VANPINTAAGTSMAARNSKACRLWRVTLIGHGCRSFYGFSAREDVMELSRFCMISATRGEIGRPPKSSLGRMSGDPAVYS